MRIVPLILVLSLLAGSASAQATGASGPGPNSSGNAAAAAANAHAAAGETRNAALPFGQAQVQLLGGGQVDNCPLPGQAALGTLTIALTAIWNHTDKSCEHIRQSIRLQQLGYVPAAVQVLCELKTVRKAMARAGTPCEAQVIKR